MRGGTIHAYGALNIICGKKHATNTGTAALLVVAMIYHSVYNTLVRLQHQLVGFLLPVITFIPVLVLLNKTEKKEGTKL